ncbi:unnamed protein product [Adineta ricciae]|uniref:Uncharacterized protein n=1 Tax=Adineta ricciae TaxID=249248 RepID=A0A815LSJ2_ADIRI|nr:unnamed protein product [Adineta ricciae]
MFYPYQFVFTFLVTTADTGVPGNVLNTLGITGGIAIDSQRNICIVCHDNDHVMKCECYFWYGHCRYYKRIAGNNSATFSEPFSVYLDETNSCTCGNGQGSHRNQLDYPYYLCASKKTGDIYIEDIINHRIQH